MEQRLGREVGREGGREGGVGPFSVLKTLLSPPLTGSTLLLWGVMFSNAFAYYGLVLLTSELTGGMGQCDGGGGGGGMMAGAEGVEETHFYRDVFITSFAGGWVGGWVCWNGVIDSIFHAVK